MRVKGGFMWRRWWGLVLLLGTLLVACSTSEPTPKISGTVYFPVADSAKAEYLPGQVLVAFKPGAVPGALTPLTVKGARLLPLRSLDLEGAYLYRIDSDVDPRTVAAELSRRPEVRWAQPNYILHAFRTPNDEFYSYQWHYPLMHLPEAWDIETGVGRVVKVAVLDTGAVPHPDLDANLLWSEGYDFVSDPRMSGDGDGRDPDPTDVGGSYHGTHVAGTIAAVTNNGVGVAGVSWGAKVVPVRVLGPEGGSVADIVDALRWVADRGVEVVNMSLGGGGSCAENPAMQEAIDYALSKGVVVVVAAGNDNADASGYSPASCSGVITVGAVDLTGGRAPYSNYGPAVEVMAPGGNTEMDANGDGYADGVLSTVWDDETGEYGYAFYQGTSMATPHVAGLVALLKAHNRDLTPAQVKDILMRTADPIWCDVPDGCGAGLVNAAAALRAAGSVTTGDFSIALEPAALVLEPGSRRAVSVRIVRERGFSGDVALEVEGVPPGVRYALSPMELTGGASEATLVLEASGASVPGDYVITVRARSGSLTRTAQLSLYLGALRYDVQGTWVVACYYIGPPYYCDDFRSWLGTIVQSGLRAGYETEELDKEGEYLMVAWQDVNGNEEVDDGDYVGVYPELVRPPAGRIDLPLLPFSSYDAQARGKVLEILRWGRSR